VKWDVYMMDVDTALQLAPLIHMGKRNYWEKAVGSGSPKSGSKSTLKHNERDHDDPKCQMIIKSEI
jgi:hypothetical protein